MIRVMIANTVLLSLVSIPVSAETRFTDQNSKKATTFSWKGATTFRNYASPSERMEIMTMTSSSSKLDGIWVRDASSSLRGFKWFYKGCVSVTYADIASGQVINHYEGAFQITDDGHREIFAYSTTSTSPPPGKIMVFKDSIAPDGKSYRQMNEQGGVETWQRLPETRPAPEN